MIWSNHPALCAAGSTLRSRWAAAIRSHRSPPEQYSMSRQMTMFSSESESRKKSWYAVMLT